MGFLGGGFFGSGADDSETTSSQGTSGAQTQEGNPLSVNISSGKKLEDNNITVKNETTVTDHGAVDGAFQLASDATMETISGITKTAGDMAALAGDVVLSQEAVASDAIENNTLLAGEALQHVADTNKNQTLLLGDLHSSNVDFLEAVNNDFTSQVGEISNESLETLENATTKAMDYVFESSKSETERVTEQFLQWGLGGVAAVILLVLFFGGKINV